MRSAGIYFGVSPAEVRRLASVAARELGREEGMVEVVAEAERQAQSKKNRSKSSLGKAKLKHRRSRRQV